MSRLHLVALLSVACVLTLAAPANAERKRMSVPRAAAAPLKPPKTTCQVENLRTAQKGTSLQSLIAVAAAGDAIQVKGTCIGASTVERNLTLVGKSTKATPVPTLDGAQQGSVLLLKGADLSVRDLRITNGIGTPDPDVGGRFGGGIESWGGDVTLRGTTEVTGNEAVSGGGGIDFYRGIAPFQDSQTFVLRDAARVSGNSSGAGVDDVWSEDPVPAPNPINTWSITGGILGEALAEGTTSASVSNAQIASLSVAGDWDRPLTVSSSEIDALTVMGVSTLSDSTIGSLGASGEMTVTGGTVGEVALNGIITLSDAAVESVVGNGTLDVDSGSIGSVALEPGVIQRPGGIMQFAPGMATVTGGHVGSIASGQGSYTRVTGGVVDSISSGNGSIAEIRDNGHAGTVTRDGNCPVVVAFGGAVDTLDILSGPQNVLIGANGSVGTVNDYVCGGGLMDGSLPFVGTYNLFAVGCS
jgi:hypothetical protein